MSRLPTVKREVLSEVNARIYKIAVELTGDWPDEGWGFICECGRARCVVVVPLTLVTYSVRLRCLGIACLPRVFPLHLQFAPAHVVYRAGTTSGSLQLTWPPLLLFSRVDLPDLANVDPDREAPWRAELTSLPRVSYSISPGLAAGLLLGGAGLLVLAALGLAGPFVLRALRIRVFEPSAPPLSPLEHALLLLEHDGVGEDAVEERRNALQLLAAELGRQGRPELASNARQLAWSEPAPPVAAMHRLAKDARPRG